MKYGVNFHTDDAYFEVEAEDEEDAMFKAQDLLMDSLVGSFEWDCNECMRLDYDE